MYLSLSKFEGNVYYVRANVLKLFRGRHFKWHFVVKPDRASTKHRELAQQGSNSGTLVLLKWLHQAGCKC